jgi:hypothetical protein
MSDNDVLLSNLERWWRETDNSLYVWEAISLTLGANPSEPMPEWCLPYLSEVAHNLTALSWATARRKMLPQHALARVAETQRSTEQR